MEENLKQLLLKDLCARLPYFENWIQYEGKDYIVTGYGHGRVSLLPSPFSSSVGPCPLIEEVKPYLRPMSSMTEEEENEWLGFNIDPLLEAVGKPHARIEDLMLRAKSQYNPLDWLNEHHFDYRGLIEKGLALESRKDMYK